MHAAGPAASVVAHPAVALALLLRLRNCMWAPLSFPCTGRRLLSAAKRGDVEAAQRVVDVTGDVAVKDDAGWTPLMHAASRGHVAVASMLLRNGAATEYKQQRARFMAEFEVGGAQAGPVRPFACNSPLHWAAFHGHTEMMWQLLQAGFRVEDVDVHANTLLHLAASSGSASALECVMSQGFDLAATNRFGNTARDLATAPAVAALFVSATAHPACPITHIGERASRRAAGTPASDSNCALSPLLLSPPSPLPLQSLWRPSCATAAPAAAARLRRRRAWRRR